MRFVQRNLWPCLALLLTGCSLVVDFPEPRDAGVGSGDGGRGANCDLATHDGCLDSELCCPVPDGRRKACLPKSAEKCTSCGSEGACTDPAANRCGKDGCECERGSGQACSDGLKCSTATDKPPSCVGCDVDSDCKALGDTAQCVDQECRLCDRGDPNDPTDDEGCPPQTPICNANGQCVGCSGPQDCGGQECIPGQGCFGCSITAPIGRNNCTSMTRPVCKAVNGGFQCAGCLNDAECMSGNFCDETNGACTPECNPGGPSGSNGCSVAGRGFCKQTTSGGYECQACTPADCTGNKPFCLTDTMSSLRGQCVECLTSTDCMTGQICDPLRRECRSQMATDCTGTSTPILVGDKCVQCATDTHCAAVAGAPFCNTTTNMCQPCSALTPNPNAGCMAKTAGARPFCSTTAPTTGQCVQCLMHSQCTAALTPICTNNACVACTGSDQCVAAYPGMASRSICVTMMSGVTAPTGTPFGSCSLCTPYPTLVPPQNGCTASAPICSVTAGVTSCGAPPFPGGPTPRVPVSGP